MLAGEIFRNRVYRDFRGGDARETVHPGTDGGKSDGLVAVGRRQVKAVAVGVFQNTCLMLLAASPDGPHGMDHRFGGEIARQGNNGLAGGALPLLLTDAFAGLKQRRPCGAMNGAIHPAPAHQRGIGGIDYYIYMQCRDITLYDFNSRLHSEPLLAVFLVIVPQAGGSEREDLALFPLSELTIINLEDSEATLWVQVSHADIYVACINRSATGGPIADATGL